MRKIFLIGLLLMMLVPAAEAQQPLTVTYVDPDGTLMLQHPSAWRLVKDDLSYEFIIPNNRYSVLIFTDPADDPVESLEFWAELDDVKIEEFTTPAGKPAARTVEHGFLTTVRYAVALGERGDGSVSVNFIGGRGYFNAQEATLLAILDTIAIPTEADMPAEVAAADALELTQTYEQGDFSFNYPDDWFWGGYQGKVALSNVQGRAQYREPEFVGVNSGEVVVLVYPDIASLPGIARRLIEGDEPTLENVSRIMAIGLLVEGGTSMDFEADEIELGDYEAVSMPLFAETEDYLLIVVELPEDRFVTVIGVVEPGELPDFENTFLAIAESVAVAE